MSENLGHLNEPGTDGCERVVVVGLIATPPDHPARVTSLLSAELAERRPVERLVARGGSSHPGNGNRRANPILRGRIPGGAARG